MITANIDLDNNPNAYFAAEPAEVCANSLIQRARSFFNTTEENDYLRKLAGMWNFYHGVYNNNMSGGHEIVFAGQQGELVQLPVNHFRNLAQHMLVMVTANRPIMECRAINGDYKSMSQSYLANGILEYYMREKGLEKCFHKATEMAIVMGSGYILADWNATGGEEVEADPNTNEIIYQGQLEFRNLSPLDVVFDGSKDTWEENTWFLVRTYKNKFDLIAKYPELADRIKGLSTKSDASQNKMMIWSNDVTDDVPVFRFYHKSTEAIPGGRYIEFCDSNCIFQDTKLPYRRVPLFRIVPSEYMGTPYGYTPMFDIYPLQEGINSLYSAILTNQNAFAVQNLFVERGSDLNLNSLGEGMNIIEGNKAPIPLQLTSTPKEVFDFLGLMVESAETISGVNSVARGNPESSLKSGTALALVQSMSLQFISGLQQSYVKMIEDVGSAVIEILKDYANSPQLVAIVGKDNRTYMHEFTGSQIQDVSRVVVDVGNPLSRSISGRVQMAEQLLQMNLLKSPEQYFQVIETGRIQNAYQGEIKQSLLIQKENEKLLEGFPVAAVMLDKHRMHIQEHSAVLADPDLRDNAELVANTLNHIQQHINYLRTSDPNLLGLIGEQALPPVPDPNMMPVPEEDQGPDISGGQQPSGNFPSMMGDNSSQPGGFPSMMPSIPSPPEPFSDMAVLAKDTI